MARYELRMPKMGESIIEATILNWVKSVGDRIELDDTIVEIATDKVDSEVPSPVEGTLLEIKFEVDDVVPVGDIIAIIGTEGESGSTPSAASSQPAAPERVEEPKQEPVPQTKSVAVAAPAVVQTNIEINPDANLDIPSNSEGRFYSPLVRSIASSEGISLSELENLTGSGLGGRITKSDILGYVQNRQTGAPTQSTGNTSSSSISSSAAVKTSVSSPSSNGTSSAAATDYGSNVEIIEMDRMRKMIAKHMVDSVQTSPHVTSFVEADVTNLVNWRNSVKLKFQEKYGEKITFTPIFIEALVKAIKDFPNINASVDGNNLIIKKDINVGMAAALPSGNLIVPVIKNADHLNLLGITKAVNDLANRARTNKLKPEEIQGGTYTLTNVGTFGNVLGTPIINQPQVAIMAAGAIRKKPAVLETEHGDVIAIRHMMFLSHSYDHRVVDGYLGGSFVRRLADYLEQFDPNREI